MTQPGENEQQSIFLSAEVYRRAAKGDEEAITLLRLWELKMEKNIEIVELKLEKERINKISRIFPIPIK